MIFLFKIETQYFLTSAEIIMPQVRTIESARNWPIARALTERMHCDKQLPVSHHQQANLFSNHNYYNRLRLANPMQYSIYIIRQQNGWDIEIANQVANDTQFWR